MLKPTRSQCSTSSSTTGSRAHSLARYNSWVGDEGKGKHGRRYRCLGCQTESMHDCDNMLIAIPELDESTIGRSVA